ncbi:MAG: sugar kinase [Rhodobacteraceae bacterium]|nr:MAG: sugar kinase [Paracoccaceae bacterium]
MYAPLILCAGLVALDFEFSVTDFPKPGLKHKASGVAAKAAGGALNAAAAVNALGGRAYLRAALGDDPLADLMRSRITARGVAMDGLHCIAGQITPHSAVLIQPGGERTVINYRDDRLCDALPPLPRSLRFDAALCDTRFPALSAPVLAAARKAGKPAVLDAEAPVRQLGDALHLASHIAFSEQGLIDYAGACTPATLRDVSRSLGAWVCVTRGPKPVLCDDGSTGSEVPVPATQIDNSNGAGDFWHAAFTLGLALGQPEIAAVACANDVTARHLSGRGITAIIAAS